MRRLTATLTIVGILVLLTLICFGGQDARKKARFIATCEEEIARKSVYEPVHRYNCVELWNMTYGGDR